MIYTATHTNPTAARNHITKIKKRGGVVQRTNNKNAIEIKYWFHPSDRPPTKEQLDKRAKAVYPSIVYKASVLCNNKLKRSCSVYVREL